MKIIEHPDDEGQPLTLTLVVGLCMPGAYIMRLIFIVGMGSEYSHVYISQILGWKSDVLKQRMSLGQDGTEWDRS